MSRKPNLPCAVCGRLLWSTTTSLPVGLATCQPCRRLAKLFRTLELCSLDGCEKVSSYRGMCRSHYNAWLYRRPALNQSEQCIVSGCHRRKQAYDMCIPHRTNVLRKADRPKYLAKKREESRRRRALERGAFVSAVNDKTVFEMDCYRCYLCGKKCDPTAQNNDPNQPTIDHVIPLAAGGTHEPANVRTACRSCNCAKSDKGGGEQFAIDLTA